MKMNNGLNFDNTYLDLNSKMVSPIEPKIVNNPELIVLNKELANELELDIDFLSSKKGNAFLSGTTNEFGPLFAQAYAGHQYAHFTMLGDGRALMLGEHVTSDKKRFDLQLKGSGTTPYSRKGDGKATLYSMLREYVISEALHALDVPTTRSLAIIKTNEQIRRSQYEEGAILTRVASSHIRVGTFEYAKAYGGIEVVKELADYTINRHYKELVDTNNKYQEFLHQVIKRQASLIAKWQSVGFIHGVMNTDNMLISGETIDYGPCAFMDTYDQKTVFSSIDTQGRYAYQNQPYIGSWNLARFAETILELLSREKEEAVQIANNELQKYGSYFQQFLLKNMASKIGIKNPTEEDKLIVDELLDMMEKYEADYTNTFVSLSLHAFEELPFYKTKEWNEWFIKWTRALGYRQMDIIERITLMKKSNPSIIPRNHIVEEALNKAAKQNDFSLYNEILEKVQKPFDYLIKHENKFINSNKNSKEYVTYCGT
jgi:uncharacterized protein YdiU (UPF0061 family)